MIRPSKPCRNNVCNPLQDALHCCFVLTQVLQSLLHRGGLLVASMDDVSNGVFILPTFAKHFLALVHRLRDSLRAGCEVASLEHLKNYNDKGQG